MNTKTLLYKKGKNDASAKQNIKSQNEQLVFMLYGKQIILQNENISGKYDEWIFYSPHQMLFKRPFLELQKISFELEVVLYSSKALYQNIFSQTSFNHPSLQ